jgi:branched-chain amino acid transport system permease protein
MLLSILIKGLVSGGMYAVLAVGFSLVFGVAKILNLAHTAFYMATAFLIVLGTLVLGIKLPISAILAVAASGILGMVCYKLCFDRVKVHETAVMIISMAIAMLFQEVFLIMFSEQFRIIKAFFPGFVEIAGVRVLYQQLFALGVSFGALISLWGILSKTKWGKAIRAVNQDVEIANLVGIDVSRVSLGVLGLSAMLAGVAAVAIAPIVMVHPLMWTDPLVVVLSAVVLGGLGSIKGSVIAAFALGLAETGVIFVVPSGSFLKGAISLTVMVAVLLIRPEGLMGVMFEEERL